MLKHGGNCAPSSQIFIFRLKGSKIALAIAGWVSTLSQHRTIKWKYCSLTFDVYYYRFVLPSASTWTNWEIPTFKAILTMTSYNMLQQLLLHQGVKIKNSKICATIELEINYIYVCNDFQKSLIYVNIELSFLER